MECLSCEDRLPILPAWLKYLTGGILLGVLICKAWCMLMGCPIPTNASTATTECQRFTIDDLAWSSDGHLHFVYQIELTGPVCVPVVGIATCLFLDAEGREVGADYPKFFFEPDFRDGKVRHSLHALQVHVPPKATYIIVQAGNASGQRTHQVRLPPRRLR